MTAPHPKRSLLPAVGAVVAALVLMTPGTSAATDLVPSVPGAQVAAGNDVVGDVLPGPQGEAPAEVPTQRVTADAPAPASSSDDDSAGHETANPKSSDHGGATVADLSAAGEQAVTAGRTNATVEDDDSTTADATLLALGGQEVIGTHADSEGPQESHFGDPLAPLCEGSEGQVCLRLLYADAWATDDSGTSRTRSQTGVADVCLGGNDASQTAKCSGPVDVAVASSEGAAQRNQDTGRTSASSRSSVADACVERDAETGTCAVGASLLASKGRSNSGGSQASAERDTHLVALTLGNEERARYSDANAIALPPECPPGTSLLCVFLNQGETYVKQSAAGHAAEALHLDVLPGILDLKLELGQSETFVRNDGRTPGVKGEVKGIEKSANPRRPATVFENIGGVLPNTGGFWSGLLSLALLALGAGSLLLALSRRRAMSIA